MKKLISLITIIALLIATLTIFASCGGNAGAASVEATKYENITWSYDSDTKTLKIVGDNNEPVEMPTIEKGKSPWYAIRTSAVKIEISGVKKISDFAFYSMYYVKEISFGDAVTEIGKCSFAFCASLVELKNLPEGLTAIGESAFEGCGNLKTVVIPQSVTTLGNRVFGYDHALTEITLPEALKDVASENKVFEGIENAPKLNYVAPVVEGDSTDAPTDSETTESTEAPSETEAPDATEEKNETDAPETDADAKPQNNTATIIAIVILALVIVGIIVGSILLMRSNKNQAKDSRTVRKSDDDKTAKNNKNAKYNKNSKTKGKKK